MGLGRASLVTLENLLREGIIQRPSYDQGDERHDDSKSATAKNVGASHA